MKRKKIVARARKGGIVRQVAAMPYRRGEGGELQIMLVTARSPHARRFILPKGWRIKGETDARAAAREAAEEAGVVGPCSTRPLGRFSYWKRLKRDFVWITVQVYPLKVERQLDEWADMQDRERAWVSPRKAAALLDQPELASLVTTAALVRDMQGG